jgi:multiple sugar transport system substrate-binding protein
MTASALAVAGALALSACGSSSGTASSSGSGLTSSKKALTVLIAPSGDAEKNSVTSAVANWSKSSGTAANVLTSNAIDQQLAQGFAAGKPADVFYLSAASFAGYASKGDLLAYGSKLTNKSDFYPSLVTSFTYKNQFYCAPKDFSTLQLVINTDMWKAAGLTDSDYPTTWAQLETVSKKLTDAQHVGLAIGGQYERLGAFMTEAGGNLMNATSTKATANSAANVTALTYAKKLLDEGVMKFAADVGAGWGGEAFGKGLSAMTIEGNWITGGMQADYPSVKYTVVQLPAGPAGKGTLQYTDCWGIAKASPNQAAALKLVETLTGTKDLLSFSKAFGVMPPIQSAAAEWKTQNPALVAFLDGAKYAQNVPAAVGAAAVVSDFDAKIGTLATTDPKPLLETTQTNLEAILK